MNTIALNYSYKKWGFAIKPNYNYKITKTLYFCTKTVRILLYENATTKNKTYTCNGIPTTTIKKPL